MNIVIESPRNSKDLAVFLAKMNAEPSQHIGYLWGIKRRNIRYADK